MSLRFAKRTAWDLAENQLTALVSETRRAGRALIDLTESNPTRVGLVDAAPIVALLGHPRGARYAPEAFGMREARAAVARYYEERGLAVDAQNVVLSASTSEAYGWLFKLLAERGERVLVPAPSYPLLGYVAGLEDVELGTYRLVRDDEGFRIDMDSLVNALDRETRAIVVVSPNNPTGSLLRRDEADDLDALAARHGIALIVDEVFGDYVSPTVSAARLRSNVRPSQALTFVLSGLSKVALLPQLKLGWTVVQGEAKLVREALRRLEIIADTYLSVATPVQAALSEILAHRAAIQEPLQRRLAHNLGAMDRLVEHEGRGRVRRVPMDGGWYATLLVDRAPDADATVATLIREDHVLVHPGYFFDMAEEGAYVVSLLPAPDAFAGAARALVRRLAMV